MLNNIAIGLSVTLDTQTRTLTRLSDGKYVSLPASACLCLYALTEANGEVLSQEQLMDIGWRSSGVEVTDNSVRVMINKLRRALNDLEIQNDVTLLAVTRSGYRLIVRESGVTPPPEEEKKSEEPLHISPNSTSQPAPAPRPSQAPALAKVVRQRGKGFKAILALSGGVIAGLVVSLFLHTLFILKPTRIDYVPWYGEGIPPNTHVEVPKDKRDWTQLIEETLKTYTRYASETHPDVKPAKVLYITLGSSKSLNHQGLIACQQPLQDSNNDCESYYFRIY
ncbi:transcriptional regulator [Pantoea sp. SOD02]|uniref:transcriptional regulator n=1 Tax=Pantoea sp. SOD02 TaxID=2970818 RepID=UPI002158032B|nr:winged helix-turn-helix domain-containing protein [Pantoea sp. SOD02]UVC29953.1 winged helix-turn-helix domain-containing protein [Pantoea sp. SOD02]